MEIDYTYSYLIANAVELAVWLLLFSYRKDIRPEMLLISVLFGIAGVFSEFIYIHDWWHPLTLTGTPVGVEDFFFGFWIGGISAVIYEVVFRKILRPVRKNIKQNTWLLYKRLFFLNAFLAFVFFGTFYFFGLSSFFASVIALAFVLGVILFNRPDLTVDAIVSGLLLIAVGIFWFFAPALITPGWVDAHWYTNNLSGIRLLGAPLEDLIWGFLAGAYIGPLYEWARGVRLSGIRKKK